MTGISRRRAMRIALGWGGTVGLAIAGLTACSTGADGGSGGAGGTGGASGTAKKPVVIGAAVSTSGSSSAAGEALKQGYTLWAEHVNQRGGLLGRPVQLNVTGDASDPTSGGKLYEKMIADDKVDLVLGPDAGSTTQTASVATEKNHYAMLAAGIASSDIWKRNFKYVFGVTAIAETSAYGVIDLALRQGYKTLAIVHEETIVPVAIAGGAAQYARAKGLQVVYQEKYTSRAQDFSAILGKVKGFNPEAMLVASYLPDGLLLTRQMKAADVSPKLVALSIAAMPEYAQELGTDADYIVAPSIWEPALKTTGNREFVDGFRKQFSREPDTRAAAAYAAGQILEAAVKKANSLDNEKVRDALAALDVPTILPGKYKVDDTGMQVGHTPVLVQWQGKDKVIVFPDQFAAGSAKLPAPPWKGR